MRLRNISGMSLKLTDLSLFSNSTNQEWFSSHSQAGSTTLNYKCSHFSIRNCLLDVHFTHLKGQVTSIPRPGLPVHAEVAVISNIGIRMKYLMGWWTSDFFTVRLGRMRRRQKSEAPTLGKVPFAGTLEWLRSLQAPTLQKLNTNRLGFLTKFNSVVFKQRWQQNTL